MRKRNDVEEVKEVQEKSRGIAAFFDLDGTLMPGPSMERRFFRMLRYRQGIGVRNYLLWLREAARLMPRGMRAMLQANKMYLRGVMVEGLGGRRQRAVPPFFRDGIERAAWHARVGHAIVVVSGTLEPLAREAARRLEVDLATRGIATRIPVFATQLEEKDGRWTGKILDEPMVGEAKERVTRRMAQEMGFKLTECFAYGDSAADAGLLAAVGRPTAVNPSRKLGRIAKKRGWPATQWKDEIDSTQRSHSSQRRTHGSARTLDRETENRVQGEEIKEQF